MDRTSRHHGLRSRRKDHLRSIEALGDAGQLLGSSAHAGTNVCDQFDETSATRAGKVADEGDVRASQSVVRVDRVDGADDRAPRTAAAST